MWIRHYMSSKVYVLCKTPQQMTLTIDISLALIWHLPMKDLDIMWSIVMSYSCWLIKKAPRVRDRLSGLHIIATLPYYVHIDRLRKLSKSRTCYLCENTFSECNYIKIKVKVMFYKISYYRCRLSQLHNFISQL